jgi:hypothetical protein
MDTCRSYCLNSRQDDFAELDTETRRRNTTDIHYVIPANDNTPTKIKLSVRCRAFLRRLIAMPSLSWPNDGLEQRRFVSLANRLPRVDR